MASDKMECRAEMSGSSDSLEALMPSFRSRGACGESGTQEQVITNSFKVEGPVRAALRFFDVHTMVQGQPEPPRLRKDENRKLISQVIPVLKTRFGLDQNPIYAYDDEKTLVLVNTDCSMAKGEKQTVPISVDVPTATGETVQIIYDVCLTCTKFLNITEADFRMVDPNDREAVRKVIERLQAVNLLLREAISDVRRAAKENPNHTVVSMGDKVYSNVEVDHFRDDQEKWRAIWPGFTAAVRVARTGLILTADQTHSVFFQEEYLSKAICNVMRIPMNQDARLRNEDRDKLTLVQIFRGRQVEFLLSDGQECENGILGKIGRPCDMQWTAGAGSPTVLEAFKARNKKIQYPNLPTVEVRVGAASFWTPAEYCYLLPGQRYQKALTKQEQATFIRIVGKTPDHRIRLIKKFLNLCHVREHEVMTSTGIVISNDFISIRARLLPQPVIQYEMASNNSGGVIINPVNATWTLPRTGHYNMPAEMPNFLVLVFPNRDRQPCLDKRRLESFIGELRSEALRRGMMWQDGVPVVALDDAPNFGRQITDHVQQKAPRFVFGIFERGMDRQYADFKKVMDNEMGVLSQGLLAQTVLKNPRGCVENIMYKVNVKCGGTNNILSETSLNNLRMLNSIFMIVGISLSHGKTKDTDTKPSYAGFVASADDSFRAWLTETSTVEANVATLPDITGNIVNLLQLYKQNTGCFPQVMIVYRDGVTRTHEVELHRNDLKCIREAFRKLQADIKLVFVVVNKMHRIRFFRNPKKNPMGELEFSKDNIPSGLVIDSEVVDAYDDDFYLASHRGALGTSRPIRYHILVNEDEECKADDIQQLTMSLCFIYQRCTLGVSIPAPLYYANLAAARCSVLADGVIRGFPKESFGGGGRGGRGRGRGRGGMQRTDWTPRYPEITRGIQIHPRLKELKRLTYI